MLSVAKLSLCVFLAMAAALKIKLLEPTEKTMWTSGADVEVFWKIDGGNEDGKIKKIELDLMQGRATRPELVNNIAFGVDWDHGDTFWTVDEKLPTGDDYFIRITSPDDQFFVCESKYFTIKNTPIGKNAKTAKKSGSGAISFGPGMLSTIGIFLSAFLGLV